MKAWKNLFGSGDKIKSSEIWHNGMTLEDILNISIYFKGSAVSYFNSDDCNDYITPGIYTIRIADHVTNTPDDTKAWTIVVIVGEENRLLHLAWRNTSAPKAEIYVRTKQHGLGTWQDWVNIT